MIGRLAGSLAVGLLLAACGGSIRPTSATATVPGPSAAQSATAPIASFATLCGTLEAGDCAKAVAVALGTLPAAHPTVTVVRLIVPSSRAACPSMLVGPGVSGLCDLIVTLSTSGGEIVVPLVRGGEQGWVPSYLVR